MRVVLYSIISIFLFSVKANAQNLVSNAGFEENTGCPEKNGDIKKCISWSSTSPGSTPDYFHKCFQKDNQNIKISVPQNSEGYRIPVSGDAYVGLALFFKKSYFSREYIQNKLMTPLEKGVKYKISFYISLSDSSEFISDHIGVCFSIMPNGIMASVPEALLTARHMITIRNKELLSSRNWQKVEAEYTAAGGEEYLIIGSFRSNMTQKEYKKKIRKPVQPCTNGECAAYYFIDEVSLSEAPSTRSNPRFK
jgi:hypothetical protein